jgi:hypothetical protein
MLRCATSFCASFHMNWSAGRGMAVRSADDGVGKGFGRVMRTLFRPPSVEGQYPGNTSLMFLSP